MEEHYSNLVKQRRHEKELTDTKKENLEASGIENRGMENATYKPALSQEKAGEASIAERVYFWNRAKSEPPKYIKKAAEEEARQTNSFSKN